MVSGQTYIGGLADMDVKDMASGALKAERAKQHEHSKMALMDKKSYEKYAGKEVVDGILKCPKCKSMKTEYTEVQTRSADEPTTKKCFCNTCNYRWKCAARPSPHAPPPPPPPPPPHARANASASPILCSGAGSVSCAADGASKHPRKPRSRATLKHGMTLLCGHGRSDSAGGCSSCVVSCVLLFKAAEVGCTLSLPEASNYPA